MKTVIILAFFFTIAHIECLTQTITISQSTYEQRPHYVIQTSSATYYYDKAGGGLSRMIDPEGNDWIGFKRDPWDQYPASAASAYRGIPNFVFRSDDSGAGHPGHDQCHSEIVGENMIISTSKSGKWKWRWTFYEDRAKVEMLKNDPEHSYWFLYEGIPGGTFEPSRQYFGNDGGGPYDEQWDYFRGDKVFDHFRWAYFGHREIDRVLFIAQQAPDSLIDTFSYLGSTEQGIDSPDGMVVFGFGRKAGAQPLMRNLNTFVLGFIEIKVKNREDHHHVDIKIQSLLE